MADITISREDLIAITEQSLKGSGLRQPEREALRQVAKTTKTILSGGWTKNGCGCLVGTLYLDKLPPDASCDDIERVAGKRMEQVGEKFDDCLDLLVAADDPLPASTIVKVV